jgi:hypothetical protein
LWFQPSAHSCLIVTMRPVLLLMLLVLASMLLAAPVVLGARPSSQLKRSMLEADAEGKPKAKAKPKPAPGKAKSVAPPATPFPSIPHPSGKPKKCNWKDPNGSCEQRENLIKRTGVDCGEDNYINGKRVIPVCVPAGNKKPQSVQFYSDGACAQPVPDGKLYSTVTQVIRAGFFKGLIGNLVCDKQPAWRQVNLWKAGVPLSMGTVTASNFGMDATANGGCVGLQEGLGLNKWGPPKIWARLDCYNAVIRSPS